MTTWRAVEIIKDEKGVIGITPRSQPTAYFFFAVFFAAFFGAAFFVAISFIPLSNGT
jgi:hypothetical protein